MEEFNVNDLDEETRKDIKEILKALIKNGLLMPDIADPDYCLISTDFLNVLEEVGGGKNGRHSEMDKNIPRFTDAP
ncbi:MAG: hypothetical protein Q618_VCMC00001G0151 [Varibaculum cambriense DORA_20]|uniref:hypothetical protein n=1 Tax=Varibaculum cambriense TaxID=184870 RepID=UPI0003D5D8DA|nr:hypothetical protein [Varibaculum cambriense]ETI82570.1 MAG: hypothetical protein Q618_VCMC00001G0151 [Varibaculum cambriense DORA_20]